MFDLLQKIAIKENLTLLPPISEQELDGFEAEVGVALALELREVYLNCGGLTIDDNRAFLIPFHEARKYFKSINNHWCYFPVASFNDSEPYYVCSDNILNGYIVRMSDKAHIKYHSIEEMLTGFLERFSRDVFYLHSDNDFEWHHTLGDIEIGMWLLDYGRTLSDAEDIVRKDAFRFGFKLLSDEYIEDITPFLDYPDSDVVGDALQRLMDYGTSEAESAVQKHYDTIQEMIRQGLKASKKAGLSPYEIRFDSRGLSIRMMRDSKWSEISIFHLQNIYANRHMRSYEKRFINLIKDVMRDQMMR